MFHLINKGCIVMYLGVGGGTAYLRSISLPKHNFIT